MLLCCEGLISVMPSVQVYAAISSSLLTGQSVAAASFGSIAVDHIQQGHGPVAASSGQLTFFCE